jgi:hypothetical protein
MEEHGRHRNSLQVVMGNAIVYRDVYRAGRDGQLISVFLVSQ